MARRAHVVLLTFYTTYISETADERHEVMGAGVMVIDHDESRKLPRPVRGATPGGGMAKLTDEMLSKA